jgi:Cys-tRNA(Pro) deacylase
MPSDSTERVRLAAEAAGVVIDIIDYPQGTKTAEQAAAAIGCPVGAIVKSLVFTVDNDPVLALVPGDRRLDTNLLADAAGGEHVGRADLDLVRRSTGFAAGGTPPFGHTTPIRVFADAALRRHDPVWAGGGTPGTVFAVSISDLDRLAGPQWTPLSRKS